MAQSTLGRNVLGDVRAEADKVMLDRAFTETPDYLSLVDSDDKVVVVGRRGTGKSALTYRLAKNWQTVEQAALIVVAPDEHEAIALRPEIKRFGDKFTHMRAAVRMACRYGILMEIVRRLSARFKTKDQLLGNPLVASHIKRWGMEDAPFLLKLRHLLRTSLPSRAENADPENLIGDLASVCAQNELEKAILPTLKLAKKSYVIFDRLDEGYELDPVGVAFIDGLTNAAIDLAAHYRGMIRPVVFLRDNMFRAVAHYDQDFTRNIEGQTLRLHWDVQLLFYLVCDRMRTAFHDPQENNRRLWNRYTANELQHDEGFKKCLQLTLYRPRDILILLNSAFQSSAEHQRDTLVMQDIERSAKAISINRLDDLRKEYDHLFPSIAAAIETFASGSPEVSTAEAASKLNELIRTPPKDSAVQLELAILHEPPDLIRSLYSIGFFGLYDEASKSFIFCHDGKGPDRDLGLSGKLLIHPCYWMALNLSRSILKPEEAEEINDEYEIKVASQNTAIRSARLGRLMSSLNNIPFGPDGASEFEDWCLDACKICFAGKLENVQLHPNKGAVNRRDLVGTNLANSFFWKRVRDDYGTRHAIFEVKNYVDLTSEDYRQMLSYLSGLYGSIGFFICRAPGVDVSRDRELAWCRAIYTEHKKLIVKLTGGFICGMLSKQRSPQKHDAPDKSLGALLDSYERVYLGQQSASGRRSIPRASKQRS